MSKEEILELIEKGMFDKELNIKELIVPIEEVQPMINDIRFIDSIMGSGKTTAMITEINKNYHSENYLYVTPFLNEAERIVDSTPTAQFKMPSSNMGSKNQHLMELIEDGENVSISHELLKNLRSSQINKFHEYNLILDEVLDLISVYTSLSSKDCKKWLKNNWIVIDDDKKIRLTIIGQCVLESMDKYKEVLKLITEGKLYVYKEKTVILELPIGLITSFKSVTIMSYLIEGSWIYQLLKAKGCNIIKSQIVDGKVKLWDEELAHSRAKEYYKLINVYKGKLNTQIKKNLTYTSQSKWTTGDIKIANNTVRNYFGSVNAKGSDSLYSFFGKNVKVKSYTKSYLSYNARATNDYAECTNLAYCIDKNNNPALKNYALEKYDIKLDENMLSLDCMLQWIFRSAIRNGKEINLFLPSLKMRKLLDKWGK